MSELDPRQIHSKHKLKDAYLTLLSLEEDQISIQQLCHEATVTRPTFYNNYSDITELRHEIHYEILNDLNESLTIRNPKPISEFKEHELPENMVGLFEHILANKKAYEILLVYQPDSRFVEEVKKILAQFISAGMRFASSKEKELKVVIPFAVPYVTGAYFESIMWWIQNEYRYTPEKMAELLLRISLEGPFEA